MAQHPPYTASGSFAPGTRLTDYTSVDLTVEGSAEGGMGLVVWGPNAFRGGKMTALKLLHPKRLAIAASRQARATIEDQFEQESLAWCHLWPHQCVIAATAVTRLTGLGNLPVLQLEYAPNGSLRQIMALAREQHRPLPLRTALAWALHIASALAHIHQPDSAHDRPAPLVHCDLKPENVLLNAKGWAQLTDLGLTRAYAAVAAETLVAPPAMEALAGDADAPAGTDRQALVARLREELRAQGLLLGSAADAGGGASLPPLAYATTLRATRTMRIPPTRSGSAGTGAGGAVEQIGEGVAGSPPYMAPEQWRGMAQTVPATDIYAFGAILYELFAGYSTPHAFPRDPQPYLTQPLYAEALAMGYDPALLAWHAAHTDPIYRSRKNGVGGARAVGEHRLSDTEVWQAALVSGPCGELLSSVDSTQRERADACLRRIDELVEACLAWAPSARPSAATLVAELAALAMDPCGLEPLQIPQPDDVTPKSESFFWIALGVTYSGLGRENEALIAKRRAVECDPDDPINWVNLGASLAAIGEARRDAGRRAEAQATLEEALDAFRQAQARITQTSLAHYPELHSVLASNEGAVFCSLERYGEAVAADERALALNSEKHDTRFNLALHYAQWSQEAGVTLTEQIARLEAAQRAIKSALVSAPELRDGRRLAERIASALADPTHRFQG